VSRTRKAVRILLFTVGVIAGLFVTTVLVAASIWPTINRVETNKSIEYPELRTRTYQLGYDRVYDEALGAAKEQKNWAVTGQERETGVIAAQALMPVTGWTQQVTITVVKKTAFVSQVRTLSEGTDTPGDLGQNARNIEAYQTALDRRLGAAKVN
jgi:hypothetical protein